MHYGLDGNISVEILNVTPVLKLTEKNRLISYLNVEMNFKLEVSGSSYNRNIKLKREEAVYRIWTRNNKSVVEKYIELYSKVEK